MYILFTKIFLHPMCVFKKNGCLNHPQQRTAGAEVAGGACGRQGLSHQCTPFIDDFVKNHPAPLSCNAN